jgi:hypothetical protein
MNQTYSQQDIATLLYIFIRVNDNLAVESMIATMKPTPTITIQG